MLEYFSKFKGNAFYSRLNSIASEHSMPLDLRVKAALHAIQNAKSDDKIM
jgi:antitoxin component of RelBE/YafQ-DinJ toxin-antitoxin module